MSIARTTIGLILTGVVCYLGWMLIGILEACKESRRERRVMRRRKKDELRFE